MSPSRLMTCLAAGLIVGCGGGDPPAPTVPPAPVAVAPAPPTLPQAPTAPRQFQAVSPFLPPGGGQREKLEPDSKELAAIVSKCSGTYQRETGGFTLPPDDPKWVILQTTWSPAPADWKVIGKSTTIQMFECRSAGFNDEAAEAISGMPNLNCLMVDGSQLTDRGLKALAKLPKLKLLYTFGGNYSGEGLAGANSLVGLWVVGGAITDAGLRTLASLPALDAVEIGINKIQLQDAYGPFLAGRFPALLKLPKGPPDDATVKQLVSKGFYYGAAPKLPNFFSKPKSRDNLVELNLAYGKVTGESLQAFGNLPELMFLNLDGTAISDGDLKLLATFPKLKHLNLTRSKVTGPGLADLATVPGLSQLNVSDLPLTEDAYRAIGALTQVSELTIMSGPVKPELLAHLSGMKSLKVITLPYTAFDDAAAAALAKAVPGLERITANYTPLTIKGMEALAAIPAIKMISVIDCRKLTKDDLAKFQKDHPKLTVSGSGG